MKRKGILIAALAVVMVIVFSLPLAGCKTTAVETTAAGETTAATVAASEGETTAAAEVVAAEKRNYFYCGALNVHPWFIDIFQGLDYAKASLNVDVTVVGPNDFDMAAMAAGIESAIPKNPAGILTIGWDATITPAIKKAMAAGIPVVLLNGWIPDCGALGYIGPDNYKIGLDTAAEFLKRGGNSGKFGIIMNAGAVNTEAKKAGVLKGLEGTDWELVVQAEDKGDDATAIEAAKAMFSAHPEMDGVFGLDSSSGAGIGQAITELGITKKMTIVVHDREPIVLEFIQKGIIGASIETEPSFMAYLGVALLENYNNRKAQDVPVSADNLKAGITLFPEFTYTGSVVINQENVDYFFRENLPKQSLQPTE